MRLILFGLFEVFVVDFDWSNGNDFIVSASSDGTYRLWDLTNGQCLRIIVDISGSHANCCIFHSQNGNFLIVRFIFVYHSIHSFIHPSI